MSIFYTKQNDTRAVTAILKDADGTAVDITGSSVVFNMRLEGSDTAKVSRGAATIVSAAAGSVKYTFSGTDTDTIGSYDAEFEVTYGDGTVETFPSRGYFKVKIEDDIA